MSIPGRLSFKLKLFTSYAAVVAMIMLLVTTALFLYVMSSMENQQSRNMAQIAQRTGNQVDEFITNMAEVSIQTGLNPICVEAFARQADQPITTENHFDTTAFQSMVDVRRTLATFKTMHFGSGRISLYDERNNYIGYGIYESSETRPAFLAGPVLRQNASTLGAMGGKVLIILPHQDYWNTIERRLLSVLWNITDLDTGVKYGFVEVQQAFSEITRLLPAGENGPEARTFLFAPGGEVIFPQGPDAVDGARLFAAIAAARKRSAGNSGILDIRLSGRTSDNIVAWNALGFSSWTLAYAQDSRVLFRPVRITGLLVFTSGILMMLLGLAVVFVVAGRLSAPLRNLTASLAGVDLDNLEMSLPHHTGDDDISLLNEAFVEMLDRLRRSTDQLILYRDHEVKAHLLALQSQMDPHFIFNILSVISASARDVHADRISEICAKLAAILRYVSDFDGGQCTMREEVSHARTYVELMKFRFEHGLEYRIEDDPRTFEIKVPKLLLQPVVENCFTHGFVNKRPPWRVEITTGILDGAWFIEVDDNGQSIAPSVLADLDRRAEAFMKNPSDTIRALKIGGLGLFNSLVRLRLLYGSGAVFRAGTNNQGGTKIVLGGRLS